MRTSYSKQEINDLANLAFISGKANLKISARSPKDYFPEVGDVELAAHYVPLGDELRTVEAYADFVRERRALLAEAMTELIDSYRPAWLDEAAPAQDDPISGETLDMELYSSEWDESQLVITAAVGGTVWRGTVALSEVERALGDAADGIAGDLAFGDQQGAVRPVEDRIEIEMGPFVVRGTAEEWTAALDREREDARPGRSWPVWSTILGRVSAGRSPSRAANDSGGNLPRATAVPQRGGHFGIPGGAGGHQRSTGGPELITAVTCGNAGQRWSADGSG